MQQLDPHKDFYIGIDINVSIADITFSSNITLPVLNASFMELIEHPNFKRNINACYDYSDIYIDLEMPEIQQHAQLVVAYGDKRGRNYKVAMVANETLNTALLGVYKLMTAKSPVEAEVFTTKKQALKWLNQVE